VHIQFTLNPYRARTPPFQAARALLQALFRPSVAAIMVSEILAKARSQAA
jgi:hypothetical protein